MADRAGVSNRVGVPDRVGAAAGVVGVVVLSAAWITAGVRTVGFDPVRQSISQLQREGTATGAMLTAAFVVFAVGALLLVPVLGRRISRTAGVVLAVAAAATLGAAASPLGEVRGGRQDAVHLGFGSVGYASLSVLPLIAGWALRRRAPRAAAASFLLGTIASACLLGTVPADAVSGALQRIGFVAVHTWLLGFCATVLLQPGLLSQDPRRSSAGARWRGSRSA